MSTNAELKLAQPTEQDEIMVTRFSRNVFAQAAKQQITPPFARGARRKALIARRALTFRSARHA